MKMILAVILALCLAGCGAETTETTAAPTAAPTEAPATVVTTAPTEAPTTAPTEPSYPLTMEVAQGEDTLTLDLFDGGGYVIYVPQGQWKLETSSESGNLTDRWTGVAHSGITVKVVNYGQTTPEAVEKQLLVLNGNYHFDAEEEEGHYRGIDNVRGRNMIFSTCTDGTCSYALIVEYPGGVRFDAGLEAMLASFALK